MRSPLRRRGRRQSINARLTPRPTSRSSTPARTMKPLRCAGRRSDVSAIRDWPGRSRAHAGRDRAAHPARRASSSSRSSRIQLRDRIELERVRSGLGVRGRSRLLLRAAHEGSRPDDLPSMAAQMPDPRCSRIQARGAITTRSRPGPTSHAFGQHDRNELETIRSHWRESHAETRARRRRSRTRAPEPKPVVTNDPGRCGRPGQRRQHRHVSRRQLGRLPAGKNVGVSSGPDGEFIFTWPWP